VAGRAPPSDQEDPELSEAAPEPGASSRFISGFIAPLRAVRYLLGHPTLLPIAALPLLANSAILMMVFFTLGPHVSGWVKSLLPSSNWGYALYILLLPVVWSLALLLGALIVNLFGTIVASPFNEMLSARVEAKEGRLPQDQLLSWAATIARFGVVVLDEIKKWALYLLVMALLAFLWLIPIAGSIAFTFLGGLVTFWFLGYEYLDHCFSRRAMRFADRRAFCWKNKSAIIGLGMAITGATLIPFVFFVMMPVAVVGATLVFVENKPQ
jgi:CysZ protein